MSDTDADLTALIADVREVIERGSHGVSDHQALRLVDAVERLTRERDDARAENERLAGHLAAANRQYDERVQEVLDEMIRREAAEAEASDLRTRLADAQATIQRVRALRDRLDRGGFFIRDDLRRALDGPQDGGEGR